MARCLVAGTALLALLTLGSAQTSEKTTAQAAAESLGFHDKLMLESNVAGYGMTWEGNGYRLVLRGGVLAEWRNTVPPVRPKGPPELKLKTVDQAWQIAEAWLAEHHIPHGARDYGSPIDSDPSGSCYLTWSCTHAGYPVGQIVQLKASLDNRSGEVRSVTFPPSMVYETPVLKVTEDEALETFKQTVKDVYQVEPQDIESLGLFYGQILYGPFGSAPNKEYRPKSTLPLCYGFRVKIVRDGQMDLIGGAVQASTGQIIGGGHGGVDFPSMEQLRPRRIAQATQLVERWAIGIALCFAAPWAYFRVRNGRVHRNVSPIKAS